MNREELLLTGDGLREVLARNYGGESIESTFLTHADFDICDAQAQKMGWAIVRWLEDRAAAWDKKRRVHVHLVSYYVEAANIAEALRHHLTEAGIPEPKKILHDCKSRRAE